MEISKPQGRWSVLLTVHKLVKRFKQMIAVDHLDLYIEEGEVFGLLGPNGAGKSTLIQMITGLLPIDSGTIKLDGQSIQERPTEVKRHIGLVPQDIAVYENISARKNVEFFAKLYGLRGKGLKESVDEALERVGLMERQHHLPSTFSGGMKRRLNIACAIAHKPKLIIMDEPTVGIDPHSRNHILESVRKLNQDGSTIIYTSHYMEEVSAIATRIGIMNEGKCIALGTEAELRQRIASQEKLTIETEEGVESEHHPAIDELKKSAIVLDVHLEGNQLELMLSPHYDRLQDILFILAKHGLSVLTLKRETPDLEHLFLSLTGRQLRD